MKNYLMLFAAAAVAVGALGASAEINPVMPFLAVTGRPTDAELGRKVAALKADGFDQFLIYARSGLQYKYMGEEWLHAVETLCREAEANGMKVWLYDEYNWPSGTCKGRVPAADERFRYSEWAVYPKDGGGFSWEVVLAPQGWVNVCEPEAVQLFIKMTHEVYEKRLAKYFASKTILGIFTDEPGHPVAVPLKPGCRKHFRRWIGMEDEYRTETGRDFRADVEGFLSGGGSAEVWSVYAKLMGRRFRTAYFDQIREWCDRMGILFTGHMINEHGIWGACLCNGDPLLAIKGESLPGIDEIWTWTSLGKGYDMRKNEPEWLTFATAQHATSRNKRGGLIELYACGPNDMTAARMRQMVWMSALHGIDHYISSMQVMDHRGLVEKHGYLSPMMAGQPWHGELKDFFADAKRAAQLACRQDAVYQVAVRYPRREGSIACLAGWSSPRIEWLLRELDGRQISVDLLADEDESDLPIVFEAKDNGFVVAKSGMAFTNMTEAARWVWKRTSRCIRFLEKDGSPADGLIVREWADGTIAALDLMCNGPRQLVAVSGDICRPCEIQSRGVLVLGPGELPPAPAAPSGTPLKLENLAYTLDRDPVFRMPFTADGTARFTVADGVGGIRLVLRTCAMSYAVTASGRPVDDGEGEPVGEQVLRHKAEPYRFELDGKPIAAARPCASLPLEFCPLYAETAPLELNPGEHVLRLVSGEPDVNYFLPAAFAAGAFTERGGVLSPIPATIAPGAIAEQGFAGFCGAMTYTLDNVELPKATAALELDVGNAFAHVRWNGVDLGTRAWAPYSWPLPSGAASRGRLEVTVYTNIVNIFGNQERKGAKWDVKFWNPQHDADSTPGLFTVKFN